MLIALHKNARTTPAVRAEIAASNEPANVLALRFGITERKMGSDHDFRLHSSYGRGLARDQAFVAKRRLIAGEPARAALCEDFR